MAYVSKINIDGVNYDILASYVGASDLSTSSGQLLSVSSGKVSKSTATIGSGTNPVYLSSGVITKSSSSVGSGTNPIYLSSGTITKSSSSVGSGTNPIYLSSGTITKSSSTVGSTSTPVYLNSGSITAVSGSVVNPEVLWSGGTWSNGSTKTIENFANYHLFAARLAGVAPNSCLGWHWDDDGYISLGSSFTTGNAGDFDIALVAFSISGSSLKLIKSARIQHIIIGTKNYAYNTGYAETQNLGITQLVGIL